MIGLGWPNSCPKELFTLGWIRCDDEFKKKSGAGDYGGISYVKEDDEIIAIITAFLFLENKEYNI